MSFCESFPVSLFKVALFSANLLNFQDDSVDLSSANPLDDSKLSFEKVFRQKRHRNDQMTSAKMR